MNTDQANQQYYDGAAAWTASELRCRQDWIFQLEPTDMAELTAAVNASLHIPIVNLRQEDFPLPGLAPKLENLRQEIVHGRGFVLIRGVPVSETNKEFIARMYFGIGTYFGDAVSQNAQGHVLGHVKDIGHDPHNPKHRVYATNYRHLFHTDSCDIVGLLCLQPAKRGGQSSIASSTSIYNEMLRRRLDLVRVLEQPFHVDRKGEIPEGKGPTYELAVFHHCGGHLTTVYARDFIQAAQRFDHVPRLTDTQVEAMDMLDSLAASDDFRLDMDFLPGDIQFLHNHQILHARSSYEDHPEPERKRHLLRLWLSAPDGRLLPERYGEIEVGKIRGGIRVPGQALTAPLDAE